MDLQRKRTKLLETISRLTAVVEHTRGLDNRSKHRLNQLKITLAALLRPLRARPEAVPKNEIANILQKCKERVARSAELLESSREPRVSAVNQTANRVAFSPGVIAPGLKPTKQHSESTALTRGASTGTHVVLL